MSRSPGPRAEGALVPLLLAATGGAPPEPPTSATNATLARVVDETHTIDVGTSDVSG